MNTRTNNENLTHEQDFSKEVTSKRDVATCTENFTSEIGQAPVFNIHIHVPPNNEANATTMYLPKILPILHVHFDELAKKLKNNISHQNKVFSENYFENVVKQITPKLGNVLLHQENNSYDRHFNKNEINILNQKQPLREKSSSIEFEGSGTDQTITMNEHNCANVSDYKERTKGIEGDGLPRVVIHNGHPIKLKKAVVVLKDILKSNSYISGRRRNLLNHHENGSSSNSPSSVLNGSANFGPQIKTEPEPGTSSCENPTLDEKPSANVDNSYVNSFISNNFTDSLNEFNKEGFRRKEILESLVEGCNFSEILQKFRQKYGRHSLKLGNFLSESQTIKSDNGDAIMENDKGTINGKFELTQDSVQTQKEPIGVVQSNDVGDQQQGELNCKTDGLNLEDGIMHYETDNQPCQNPYEIDRKCDVEMSESSNSVASSIEVVKGGVDQMHGNNGEEHSVNPYHVYEFMSDDNEITTKNKLSSDVVGNLETLEFDSSNCMSNIVIKSEFGSVKTNDLILNDIGDEYFDLRSVKKEIVSPEKGSIKMEKHKKNTPEDVHEDESSPKKIKQSPETSKRSATKSSKGEDYIPLDIPGPTEFAVVPLSNVKACKAHDAKNFKKDMLFGKRVNRFTNPEHLRMYKLKKQAGKKRSQ